MAVEVFIAAGELEERRAVGADEPVLVFVTADLFIKNDVG